MDYQAGKVADQRPKASVFNHKRVNQMDKIAEEDFD